MGMSSKYSTELEDQMVSLYLEGLDCVQIAKITGVKYNTSVRRVLVRKGIPLVGIAERLRFIKYNPFEDLSNEAVQYWLGYIASDGCVSEKDGVAKVIRLNTNLDYNMLENYCKFLGNRVNISTTYNSKFNVNEHCVGFSSVETAKHLCDLGITPCKSLTLKLNFDITWPFVRGYFEGDGSVRKNVISICTGSKDFAEQLSDFYLAHQIEPKMVIRDKERLNLLYRVELYRKELRKKWSSLVYPEGLSSLLYLPRKRDKVLNFV